MKKNYLEPAEKVVELGADARFLNDIFSEAETEEVGVGGDGEDGEEGEVKRYSIWDKIW